MAKNLSLMEVRALVPISASHALDRTLEELGATQVMFRPYRNGHDVAAEQPKAKAKHDSSNRGVSQRQQQWIADHVKSELTLSEISRGWIAAGFRAKGLYQAMTRAVAKKIVRKIKPGLYAPKGGR